MNAMSTPLCVLEEVSCEGSCSSVASLGTWCHAPGAVGTNDKPIDQSKMQLLDSFEAEGSFTSHRSIPPPVTGRRTQDSFASLAGDSSKSLHAYSQTPDDDGWIKIDFGFNGNVVEMEMMMLEGQMKLLYLMEMEREKQFHARIDASVLEKIRSYHKEHRRLSGNIAFHHEANNPKSKNSKIQNPNVFSDLLNRSVSMESGVKKSISMTTLVSESESKDASREALGTYNVDGMCIQHIFSKTTSDDATSVSDFGFVRSHDASIGSSRNSTTPKIKRGIHQSFKANSQAVRAAISRCCSWDGSSSVDSSSRWRLPSPFGFVKRFVCCESSFSSDDGNDPRSKISIL